MSRHVPETDSAPLLTRLASNLLQQHASRGEPAADASASPAGSGIVLFFDISQFTPLTTHYAEQGPAGLEALSDLINRYFADLLQPVHEHGGDVLAFFGDGVLVLFSETPGAAISHDSMARALTCALAVRERCHRYPTGEPNYTLGLKTTVAAGAFDVSDVHAPGTARKLVVYGDVMHQIGALEQAGLPGEIVLSPDAWQQCPQRLFECRSTGTVAVLVRALRDPELPDLPARHEPGAAPELIAPWIDRSVADRLSAVDMTWLAEFRTITSVFIHVRTGRGTRDSPQLFQQLFGAVAPHIVAHGGAVLRFAVEDKGIVFSCAFGMPGHPAADIAAQAVQAAFDAMQALHALGNDASAGCATGRQYCGPIGDGRRMEITVLSETVNLAARFCGLHLAHIICDEATANAAGAQGWNVLPLPPFELKGFRDPVPAFWCESRPGEHEREPGIIGREHEIRVLNDAIDAARAGTGRCVLITGEAGVGKSTLVDRATTLAAAAGVQSVLGAAGETSHEIPYNAWQRVIKALIREPFAQSAAELAEIVRDEWPPQILEALPLLCDVLGLPCQDTSSTRELQGPARIHATRRILVQLCSLRAHRAPLVIVIEDAHWLDSASWALLDELRQAACPLLLLVSLRSGEPVDDPAYARLRQTASVEHLHLDVLSRAQIRELLDHLLGGVAVSEELVDTLYVRTDGHPFFTEELFYTLRDRGALVVRDGRCVLRNTPGDPQTLDCTESINAAITSRLTRLGTVEQLTLKIASAIGDHISIPLWRTVALAVGVRDEISACIAQLCDLEFMREVIRGEVVAFKHAITRGVVYDMLTYAQRETIHGAIVRAYESTDDVNSGAIAAVIATHCVNARMFTDAVDRYEVASGLALSSGAYREAASHVASAQHLTHAHELAVDPMRLARWEHLRGEAEFQSGHLNQARQHFHKALVLLGRAGADGTAHALWDMSACTARHLLRGVRRAPILDARPSPERNQTLDADTLSTLLYERLARLAYFAGNSIEFTGYALRCLDVCERLPASLELAKSYAGAALLTASAPGLRMLAPRYARRARDVATRLARRAAVGEIELILATSAAGDGRWDEAAHNVGIALANFEQLSELQSVGHCRFLMLELCLYQGRLADARHELQHLADLGAAGNLQLGASSVSMSTWIDRRQGAFESLLALAESIDSARMQEASQGEPSVLGSTRANIAYAYARTGHMDQAEHLVDIVLHGRRGRGSPVFHAIELWLPLADTLVLLWQHAGDVIGRPLYAQKLDTCLRVMRALAPRHRITRPAYLLSRGLAGLRLRRHRDAAACFTKCAALADRLAMPFEAGRAYLELARLEADPARRAAAAAQAEERFALIGATADLDAVRALSAPRADQRTPGNRARRQ